MNPSIVENSLMGNQSLAQQVDHRSLVLTNEHQVLVALKGFVLVGRILELASTALKEAELVSSRVIEKVESVLSSASRVLKQTRQALALALQSFPLEASVLVVTSRAK